MKKVPMIKNNDKTINPVVWVPAGEFDTYLEKGYVYAIDFYRRKEAHYATMRREIEKQQVLNNVQG